MQTLCRWWFFEYFLCSPETWGRWTNFEWYLSDGVGSTTNQNHVCFFPTISDHPRAGQIPSMLRSIWFFELQIRSLAASATGWEFTTNLMIVILVTKSHPDVGGSLNSSFNPVWKIFTWRIIPVSKWLITLVIVSPLIPNDRNGFWIGVTPLKTNMLSPEDQWLDNVFPVKIVPLPGTFVSFEGCSHHHDDWLAMGASPKRYQGETSRNGREEARGGFPLCEKRAFLEVNCFVSFCSAWGETCIQNSFFRWTRTTCRDNCWLKCPGRALSKSKAKGMPALLWDYEKPTIVPE